MKILLLFSEQYCFKCTKLQNFETKAEMQCFALAEMISAGCTTLTHKGSSNTNCSVNI